MKHHTNDPALTMRGVSKTYADGTTEVHALRHVELTVRPGEMVAVMGASGSGKSTLLHLAGGLENPDDGVIEVGGVDLGGLDAASRADLRRTRIGYVFQRYNLIPSLTALENVALPLELGGVGAKDAAAAAAAALADVGLATMAVHHRFPDLLSGGEQQRVAIARALVGDRPLLLADEPTGALDSISATQIVELLAALAAAGRAVVLVTHEPSLAGRADRILVLRDGRVIDSVGADGGADAGAPR